MYKHIPAIWAIVITTTICRDRDSKLWSDTEPLAEHMIQNREEEKCDTRVLNLVADTATILSSIISQE